MVCEGQLSLTSGPGGITLEKCHARRLSLARCNGFRRLLRRKAFLSSLKRGEEGLIEERAFKKASSFCLSIAPDAGALYSLLSFLPHSSTTLLGFSFGVTYSIGSTYSFDRQNPNPNSGHQPSHARLPTPDIYTGQHRADVL